MTNYSDNTTTNSWLQTFTGIAFDPMRPDPKDVRIMDIAHALSHQCRFGGHCPTFYSVADHSVRVSKVVWDWAQGQGTNVMDTARVSLVGLLHDAAEAYVQDIVRPIKYLPEMADYRDAEDRVIRAIFARYKLDVWLLDQDWLKLADNIALATEKRDFFPTTPRTWTPLPDPLPDTIVPLSPMEAKQAFLDRFHYLADLMGPWMKERT